MMRPHAARDRTPVVELRDVARRYPPLSGSSDRSQPAAVEDVSLTLYQGEVLALLGPSGCGKSTTLRLVAGHERPDTGEVWLDGVLAATPVRVQKGIWLPPERRNIGMVFQDYALFPHLTVADNVAFGLDGTSRDARRDRVRDMLERVDLAQYAGRLPHQLSGGQQQRVALARALAPRPRAVLLDEPFNTLDAGLRDQVRRGLLALLREEGVAVLLVTHDQDEALTSADRVAVMRAGRIDQVDAPTTLYNRPKTRFVASFVGEGSFVPAVVGPGRVDTPFGAIPASGPETWLHSEEVEVLVRPEDVTIEASVEGNAVISGRRARGSVVDYNLTLRPDPGIDPRRLSPVQLHVHAPDWLEPGTPVQVTLRPRHLVAFRGEQSIISACLAMTCSCPQFSP